MALLSFNLLAQMIKYMTGNQKSTDRMSPESFLAICSAITAYKLKTTILIKFTVYIIFDLLLSNINDPNKRYYFIVFV